MKIDNPLATGNDLESLAYQAAMLRGTAMKLGTESHASAEPLNPFLGFISRVKEFAVKNLSVMPSPKSFEFKPDYADIDRVGKMNFAQIRTLFIPAVPDTDAKVADYLTYLHLLTDIVNKTIKSTLPGCKQYFSTLLSDVTMLESASTVSAIDRLSTNKQALAKLNEKYPGIIKRDSKPIPRQTIAHQYTNFNEFMGCQIFLMEIVKKAGKIDTTNVSREVNEMNEIISRVIMVVKKNKDAKVDPDAVKRVTEYLYDLAEEIAVISAFVQQIQVAIDTIGAQPADIVEQVGA